MSGRVAIIFEKLHSDQEPSLRSIPTDARGFRVRLNLHGASLRCGGVSNCQAI